MRIRYRVVYNDGQDPVVIVGNFKDLKHFERVVEANAKMDRRTEFIAAEEL